MNHWRMKVYNIHDKKKIRIGGLKHQMVNLAQIDKVQQQKKIYCVRSGDVVENALAVGLITVKYVQLVLTCPSMGDQEISAKFAGE